MDYLGLFALGAFVGAVVTYGLQFIKGYSDFTKGVVTILAAALSGSATAFLDRFSNHTKALGAYSVGLLIALMWAYAAVAVAHIQSADRGLRLLGWAHICGAVLASLTAAALVLPPAFRETWVSH